MSGSPVTEAMCVNGKKIYLLSGIKNSFDNKCTVFKYLTILSIRDLNTFISHTHGFFSHIISFTQVKYADYSAKNIAPEKYCKI